MPTQQTPTSRARTDANVESRNPRRPLYDGRSGLSALPALAARPQLFEPLAGSAVADQLADHERMASAYRAAQAALAAHERAKDAAMDADRQALADALRAGEPAPAEDEHTTAWEAEHVRLKREATGYRDALADAYATLVREVTEKSEDLQATYASEAATAREDLAEALAAAAAAVRRIDTAETASSVVDQVAEHGTDARRIRPVTAPGLLRDGHRTLGAAELLALVADYRAPRPPAPPAPSFEDVFDPGDNRRAPSGKRSDRHPRRHRVSTAALLPPPVRSPPARSRPIWPSSTRGPRPRTSPTWRPVCAPSWTTSPPSAPAWNSPRSTTTPPKAPVSHRGGGGLSRCVARVTYASVGGIPSRARSPRVGFQRDHLPR